MNVAKTGTKGSVAEEGRGRKRDEREYGRGNDEGEVQKEIVAEGEVREKEK